MSWVNDPSDLALLPELEQDEISEEEQYDPKDSFWAEVRSGGRSVVYHNSAHVGVCHFDSSGNHTQIADGCPHFDTHDEEGPRIRPGWTAQQR